LTPLYYGEIGVARRLAMLARALPSRLSDIPPDFIPLDPGLSPEQQTAIKTALSHPVSVLTGGPGTGKTTCLKSLISILQSQNKRFSLASPTGRAAKRLSEATGHPAATIHRMLDYSPTRGFTQNEENPLPIDFLVVDEASMLDLILANSLLKALEAGTHLLLVGDVDQLPSVGAGDVLRDVIASGVAPVTRLSTIFRQAAESYIISNAHRINQGQFPEFPPPVEKDKRGSGDEEKRREGDFFLFPAEDAEGAGDWTVNVVTERIPARFGFDPVKDIQVLAPMYRGPAGVRALNDRLQATLNPPGTLKPEKALFGQIFRVGDKVMQTQNDYDKEVFNGDIGQVTAIDIINHTLMIHFEGRNISFDWMECDQLTLAYCVSVHKSQGAEFPCIVLPIITAHYMMLQRNLIYTAVTRAKKLCVLVGSKKAISMAVRNNQVAERNTALDVRLIRETS
jgi:exodeoxyribonuclease V alpha subunit